MQFDKFFSLIKEFHVKIMSGSRNLNGDINTELDDQFRLTIIEFNDSANVNLKKIKRWFQIKNE